jgi:hypothetical protein
MVKRWSGSKPRRARRHHEPYEGFWNLMNLRMNITNDPLIKEKRFADVLERIRGD